MVSSSIAQLVIKSVHTRKSKNRNLKNKSNCNTNRNQICASKIRIQRKTSTGKMSILHFFSEHESGVELCKMKDTCITPICYRDKHSQGAIEAANPTNIKLKHLQIAGQNKTKTRLQDKL